MNLLNCNNTKWDTRFLDLAKLVSTWSKDPSTKVGAVIANDENTIISMGYNGFPIGIKDDERLKDRDTKYKMIIHAECNALLFSKVSLVGYKIYTYPFMPCPKCASLIIQSGITSVISYNNMPERWEKDFVLSKELFKEAGVDLLLYNENRM
jgi:dCMP deaminase